MSRHRAAAKYQYPRPPEAGRARCAAMAQKSKTTRVLSWYRIIRHTSASTPHSPTSFFVGNTSRTHATHCTTPQTRESYVSDQSRRAVRTLACLCRTVTSSTLPALTKPPFPPRFCSPNRRRRARSSEENTCKKAGGADSEQRAIAADLSARPGGPSPLQLVPPPSFSVFVCRT